MWTFGLLLVLEYFDQQSILVSCFACLPLRHLKRHSVSPLQPSRHARRMMIHMYNTRNIKQQ